MSNVRIVGTKLDAPLRALAEDLVYRGRTLLDNFRQDTLIREFAYNESDIYLLFVDPDSQPVGVIVTFGNVVTILYVAPEHRRKGYATMLHQQVARFIPTDEMLTYKFNDNNEAASLFLDSIEAKPVSTSVWEDGVLGGRIALSYRSVSCGQRYKDAVKLIKEDRNVGYVKWSSCIEGDQDPCVTLDGEYGIEQVEAVLTVLKERKRQAATKALDSCMHDDL